MRYCSEPGCENKHSGNGYCINHNMRRRYHANKEKGICTSCGRVPAREGKIYCQPCQDKHNVARQDRRLHGNKRKV